MPTKDELFPSNYLKAEAIADRDYPVTITGIKTEQNKDGTSKRVLQFKEFPGKLFGLNKTNWNTISKVTGEPDDDDWIGKRITLFTTEVQNPSGEMVLGIRVRLKAPAPAAKKAATTPPKQQREPGEDDLAIEEEEIPETEIETQ